jgi:hemerythrin
MTEGRPTNETLDALGEIFARISAHFALEEHEMRDAAYAGYAGHKDNHEELLDEIRDIMDSYEVGSFAGEREAFGTKLRDWFVNHFKTHDARLHGVLGANKS